MGIAFVSPTRALVVGGDDCVCLWDVTTGEQLRFYDDADRSMARRTWLYGLGVSFDGRLFALGCSDYVDRPGQNLGYQGHTVRVWEVESGKMLHRLTGFTDRILSTAFTSDGNRLVALSYDQTLRVWDLPGGRQRACQAIKPHLSQFQTLAALDDHRVVFAAGIHALVWDFERGREVARWTDRNGNLTGVAVSGRHGLTSGGSFGKPKGHLASWALRVWDVASNQESRELRGHTDTVQGLSCTRDGRFALSVSKDRSMRLWDLAK
jgi:WD40 repeat protein